ncbi:MAG: hypothetical protein DLM53_09900 [Candidatus Eremiobacter antarcticus]|nr:prepilin-type N-terminal cleavage/methylation domain-containing protein [Candidatus Eremiobacteraeota bacterium]MBC5808577.1 prepilin-type N-terminal cleavage/methylation domain-containing protein [Candidatus Eremiobacteraeota bacterium]PZR61156.1 MAG: hypothetical protein DLM53_09900 [Candidatus Eremiobacter sp. RRmetagenome_bin22]
MRTASHKPKQQRGTSLIEVLIATVILTIAFLFVSGDMIASTQAERQATNRGVTISMANYFIDNMRTDSSFWSEQVGGVWTTAPIGLTDPCGNAFPPYNDSLTTPTWHNVPTCAAGPFSNLAKTGKFQYMWRADQQADANAADLTVWISAQTGAGTGKRQIFAMHQFSRNDPNPNTSGVMPPGSPTPTPTPTPTPKPSMPPTPVPTPKPSGTATPVPTATPAPTPTPQPTVIQ